MFLFDQLHQIAHFWWHLTQSYRILWAMLINCHIISAYFGREYMKWICQFDDSE